MVFSSPTFLYLFLPLFLIAYFAAPGMRAKNVVFVAFSVVFYAWGEPLFVLVLGASIVVNWLVGLRIGASAARGRWLAAGLVWNLSILAVAKYADFAVVSLNALLPEGGALTPPGWPLPLGVSFFTFHAVSYLVDVYRRNAPPERSLLRLALYITMFPQLVAGPIVRYRTIARQLANRRATVWRASIGARIFIIGLAQKVLIANELGQTADVAFTLGSALDAGEAWLGLAAYSLQIYFDFAGYSNMAIGLGFVVGLGLPRNFDRPYTARSVTEFWRRWHISLSRWFRDYLYIPLGGSRRGEWRTYRNLAIVFLLCGLWHGASWSFVIWGAWYGLFLIAERAGLKSLVDRLPAALANAYLVLVVMLGWVWFRAETADAALGYFRGLAGLTGDGAVDVDISTQLTPVFWGIAAVALVLALTPRIRWRKLFEPFWPVAAGPAVRAQGTLAATNYVWFWLLALSMLAIAGAGYNPFLYFRF